MNNKNEIACHNHILQLECSDSWIHVITKRRVEAMMCCGASRTIAVTQSSNFGLRELLPQYGNDSQSIDWFFFPTFIQPTLQLPPVEKVELRIT